VIRLNRFLSISGLTSRRKALQLVMEGRVRVNGETVTEPGTPVDPDRDAVSVDERPVAAPSRWLTYVFNKPPGYLTARSDPRGRATIMDLLGERGRDVFPVGRLDRDSEGLLLLTNHGDLAHALLHPRFGIEKVYIVTLCDRPSDRVVRRLGLGVLIGPDEWARPVAVVRSREPRVLRVVLTEGKKREVRRMIKAVGHEVVRLVRIAFAGIELGGLPPGGLRPLTDAERAALSRITGIDPDTPPWRAPVDPDRSREEA